MIRSLMAWSLRQRLVLAVLALVLAGVVHIVVCPSEHQALPCIRLRGHGAADARGHQPR